MKRLWHLQLRRVAPYTAAWIEIDAGRNGMKPDCVAPYTGAWIEMARLDDVFQGIIVAPYTGAWIEIFSACRNIIRSASLPTRERGLK